MNSSCGFPPTQSKIPNAIAASRPPHLVPTEQGLLAVPRWSQTWSHRRLSHSLSSVSRMCFLVPATPAVWRHGPVQLPVPFLVSPALHSSCLASTVCSASPQLCFWRMLYTLKLSMCPTGFLTHWNVIVIPTAVGCLCSPLLFMAA